MKKEIPQIIKEIGFDFHWDEAKVWKLEVSSERMDIEELVWHFDIPFLWWSEGVYNLTPLEVFRNPKKYKEEYRRAMKSNTNYPIDIMRNKGRWLILDGLHRLMKLHLEGRGIVNVRKIDRKFIPDIEIEAKAN